MIGYRAEAAARQKNDKRPRGSRPSVIRRRHSDRDATIDRSVPDEPASKAPPFWVDDRRKRVVIEGKAYHPSPKEYALLSVLAADPGRVVSTEEILRTLWSDRAGASATDVKQYVHLLRKRIERNPKEPRWIESVRGFGYRLTGPGDS